MSLLSNPEYEAMTPTEKALWHIHQASEVRYWRKKPYGWSRHRFETVTASSEKDAQRHELCAALLINHYRLNV